MLMHMRGDPCTMQLPANKAYPGGVCAGVAAELAEAAGRAMAAGIEPWRLILDPGAFPYILLPHSDSGKASLVCRRHACAPMVVPLDCP